jgi:hypothetical protein
LLLVVVIMGIIAAITVPVFRSFGRNRLSAGARSVVSVGRYARSMAVLEQAPMRVQFNLDSGVVSVVSDVRAPMPKVMDAADDDIMDASPGEAPPVRSAGSKVALSRELTGLRIEYVEPRDGDRQLDGMATVFYRSNGTCTPYDVMLAEPDGARLRIRVDALSSVEVERQL